MSEKRNEDSKPAKSQHEEETGEKLDDQGLREIVKVNKPTDETPDRQQLDPSLPATEVDPDPTGQDSVGFYNEDQRGDDGFDEDVVADDETHLLAKNKKENEDRG